jgi:hypothetical protein
MNTPHFSRLLLLAAIAATPAIGQIATINNSATWHVDSSVNYSRGDYGFTEDTEVFLALLTVTSETAHWRFQALMPALNIKGPATVVAGGGQAGIVPGRPTKSSETGVGDLTLGAAYKFGAVFGDTSLDLGAQVKLPTASEQRGLGTGELDTMVQADLRHPMGSVTSFATLGYRFLGRSIQYQLKDGMYASLGFVQAVTSATSMGVSYNWRQRVTVGGADSSEVLGFFLHQINERWRVQGYALAGFTNASPDFGTGASLGYRF